MRTTHCIAMSVVVLLISDPVLRAEIFFGDPRDVYVQTLTFSPDGKRLVVTTMSRDPFVGVLDVTRGTLLWTALGGPFGDGVGFAAFSPDGQTVAATDMVGGVILLGGETGRTIWRTEESGPFDSGKHVRGIQWREDGRLLVVFESRVEFRDPKSGKPVRVIQSEKRLSQVVIARRGDVLAVNGITGLRLWNIAKGEEVPLPNWLIGVSRPAIDFASNERTVAAAAYQEKVRAGRLDEFSLRVILSASTDVVDLMFSPDATRIVGGAKDGSVRVWNAQTGEVISRFSVHEGPVNKVAFSPDAKLVASGGKSRTIWLSDAATGEAVRKFILPEPKEETRSREEVLHDLIRRGRLSKSLVPRLPPLPPPPPPAEAEIPANY